MSDPTACRHLGRPAPGGCHGRRLGWPLPASVARSSAGAHRQALRAPAAWKGVTSLPARLARPAVPLEDLVDRELDRGPARAPAPRGPPTRGRAVAAAGPAE